MYIELLAPFVVLVAFFFGTLIAIAIILYSSFSILHISVKSEEPSRGRVICSGQTTKCCTLRRSHDHSSCTFALLSVPHP